jgi:putative flippase GtrA
MKQFIRYTLVGALATGVHYLLLVACVEAGGAPAYLGSGIGAVVGAQVAFVGNRRFTFAQRVESLRAAHWLRFQMTALLGAIVGMAVVAGAVRLGVHYLFGQVLATAASLMLTFVINRSWTFATMQARTPPP